MVDGTCETDNKSQTIPQTWLDTYEIMKGCFLSF